jgi:putative acyl-CoA dehydrogenase
MPFFPCSSHLQKMKTNTVIAMAAFGPRRGLSKLMNMVASRDARKLSTAVAAQPAVGVGRTHQVLNQAKPFVNVDLVESDAALKRAVKAFAPDMTEQERAFLHEFGRKCTSAELMEHARLAEKNRPTLRQFDNYGRRIDVVDYHPSYHELMKVALSSGVHAYGYNNPHSGSHTLRGMLSYLGGQVDIVLAV